MSILKIQKPLIPVDGLWLVYDEGRTYMGELDPDDLPTLVRSVMKNKLKAFFIGYITESTGMLNITHHLEEDPGW